MAEATLLASDVLLSPADKLDIWMHTLQSLSSCPATKSASSHSGTSCSRLGVC